MQQWRIYFVVAIWLAFLARGLLHSVSAPLWAGPDEAANVAAATAPHSVAATSAGPLFTALTAGVVELADSADPAKAALALRIFCVLAASLAIPLTVLLLRLLLPDSALLYALPIIALAPNTFLFAARVSEFAVGWPLLTGVAAALVVVSRTVDRRALPMLSMLCIISVWISPVLAFSIPAAVATALWLSGGRHPVRRALFWTALLPVVAGSTPYLISGRLQTSADLLGRALLPIDTERVIAVFAAVADAPLLTLLTHAHFWAGGPGLRPLESALYSRIMIAVVLVLAVLLVTAVVRRAATVRPFAFAPLLALGGFFFLGMYVAILAARFAGTDALAGLGTERWPLDLLRPIEAVIIGALAVSAVPERFSAAAGRLLIVLMVTLDAVAASSILLPAWPDAAIVTPGWPVEALALTVLALSVASAGLAASGVGESAGTLRPLQFAAR
jgi:hypothetical protein